MRVQVIVTCLPHPVKEIEAALQAAGKQLARSLDSVSVEVRPTQPPTAVLEFEMRRAAQYKVVDNHTWSGRQQFYSDVTWLQRVDLLDRLQASSKTGKRITASERAPNAGALHVWSWTKEAIIVEGRTNE